MHALGRRKRQTVSVSAFWCVLPRDVLLVGGADALAYVQGQISQEIRNLGDGDSAYSFVLQPTGKVEALVRIHRRTAESFVLDTDAGFGPSLAARLNRFKIRVKVEIVPVPWHCIAVRFSESPVAGGVPAWGLDDAFDLLGDHVDPPPGIREGTRADLELARISTGWPAMGHEITESTIPAETGHVVALAVSFTKGCYPGQELVERMDSRGSTAPRLIRRLQGTGSATAGDDLEHAGKKVGTITSIVDTQCGWIGLAILSRSVQLGDTVLVGSAESVVEAASPS